MNKMIQDPVLTLVILAAGMSTRFGKGVKQLTPLGPSGETIMEYSIFDAIQAGFSHVVFITRRELEADLRRMVADRVAARLGEENVSLVFQELADLPDGFSVPAERKKPWGTGQAVLCCRDVLNGPFLVINADDFYGKEAFFRAAEFLREKKNSQGEYCMAGFVLRHTLSEYGAVTRGICQTDPAGDLRSIEETRNLRPTADGAVFAQDGRFFAVDPDALVSMNMWGLTPDFLGILRERLVQFLHEYGDSTDAEFLLPVVIGQLLKEEKITVKVLPTNDRWFGITYQEEKETAREHLDALTRGGIYPTPVLNGGA